MFNSKKTDLSDSGHQYFNMAFSLVELIVIIVILSILATLAFISFSTHSSSARDSARLSDTANIRKGLESSRILTGFLPKPSDPAEHRGGNSGTGITTVKIIQGIVNDSILKDLSAGIRDPSGSEYGYSVFLQGSDKPLYYQLAMELENATGLKADVSRVFGSEDIADAVFAEGYGSPKTMHLIGNYAFDPSLPSLFILSGSTANSSGGIFNPELCFMISGSRTNTFANKDGCLTKKRLDMRDSDSGLIGYWDMESFSGQIMRDLSGNGNDGIITGGMPGNSSAVISRGMTFAPLSYISIRNTIGSDIGNLGETGGSYTLSVITNLMTYSSGATIVLLKKLRSTSTGNPFPFYMYYWNSGAESLRIFAKDIAGNTSAEYTNTIRKGFVKIDLVIDREGKQLRLYMNGKMASFEDISNMGSMANDEDIIIGNYESTPNVRNWDGIIDDVKIYKRALTEIEIFQQAHAAGFIRD